MRFNFGSKKDLPCFDNQNEMQNYYYETEEDLISEIKYQMNVEST